MSQPMIQIVIDSLVEQGCRLRRTKGGVFLYCPDGIHTIGIHTSKHSDQRAIKNIRAVVRQAGLEWPEKVPA